MASSRVVHVGDVPSHSVAAQTLREGIAAIQTELQVTPAFPPEVEHAAAEAAARPRLPELDRTDLPLVTIDPPGSLDLDQALHIARDQDGYVVSYAIADVAAFVAPGDPIDLEANRRGLTLYGADSKVPLHPKAISEDAGSLLPDRIRPALLWTIRLDSSGETTDAWVERARVVSRAKLDYPGVQRAIDGAVAGESLQLLKEVGELRLAAEAARGGVSLPLPDQTIDADGDHWTLSYRALLPVEQWNAQISLLAGFAAARMMTRAGIGVLRTLPPADPRDVDRLRRTAEALRIDWPAAEDYPAFIRALDPERPAHAAMVVACTRLLRGSGYLAFDAPPIGPAAATLGHAGLASEYAHVTAPLRRLIDRYAGEICVAVCGDVPVPDWVTERLPDLPEAMRASSRVASRYENAIVDLVEAGVLAGRVGESFAGVIVDVDTKTGRAGTVTVEEPAIEAKVTAEAGLPLGEEVDVELTVADVAARRIRFEYRPGS